MPEYTKASFTGGVIAPALHARADFEKYASSLAQCTNFFVVPEGGVYNRPGMEFIQETMDSDNLSRLIPFEFNTEQTYMLVFGEYTMQVIKDGGLVVEDTVSITGITKASPGVITASGHGYSNGDKVYLASIGGMTELNGRFAYIANKTSTTFQLTDLYGTAIDTTNFTTYTSGGTVARVYTLTTPYAAADLSGLDYVQSNDVMTLVHKNYAQRELTRTDHDAWTITAVTYDPNIAVPTNLSVSATGTDSGSDSKSYEYVVTAVKDGQESLAVPVHNVSNVNGNGFPTYYVSDSITMSAQSVTYGASLTWTEPTGGADIYNIYKAESVGSGIFGWIGESEEPLFKDFNIAPLMSIGPPRRRNPFDWLKLTLTGVSGTFQQKEKVTDGSTSATGIVEIVDGSTIVISDINGTFGTNGITGAVSSATATINTISENYYPSAVGYYQQRILFAATIQEPQTVFASRTGNYKDFRTSVPVQDDDAITFTIAAEQVNEIRHIVDVGQLLLLTSGAIWKVTEGQTEVMTPSTIGVKRQTKHGVSNLKPVVIGDSILYVEDQQTRVRDMSLTLGLTQAEDKYTGSDLSILAQHLFRGYTIDSWCYAREPNGIIWAARSDGRMLGMTYHREHNVWGWHDHVLGASSAGAAVLEDIETIKEGTESAVYAIVRRTINGQTKRYIERLHSREFSAIEDAFFVDSGLTYSGASTLTISGLHHLEGETIVALVNGDVVKNLTVTDGEVTLPEAGTKVHLGLGYNCDIETLDIDVTGSVLTGKKKIVGNVVARFLNSRGGYVGPDSSNLTEIKWRKVSSSYDAMPLYTGTYEVMSTPKSTEGGRVHFRQPDPLPSCILSLTPEFQVGS